MDTDFKSLKKITILLPRTRKVFILYTTIDFVLQIAADIMRAEAIAANWVLINLIHRMVFCGILVISCLAIYGSTRAKSIERFRDKFNKLRSITAAVLASCCILLAILAAAMVLYATDQWNENMYFDFALFEQIADCTVVIMVLISTKHRDRKRRRSRVSKEQSVSAIGSLISKVFGRNTITERRRASSMFSMPPAIRRSSSMDIIIRSKMMTPRRTSLTHTHTNTHTNTHTHTHAQNSAVDTPNQMTPSKVRVVWSPTERKENAGDFRVHSMGGPLPAKRHSLPLRQKATRTRSFDVPRLPSFTLADKDNSSHGKSVSSAKIAQTPDYKWWMRNRPAGLKSGGNSTAISIGGGTASTMYTLEHSMYTLEHSRKSLPVGALSNVKWYDLKCQTRSQSQVPSIVGLNNSHTEAEGKLGLSIRDASVSVTQKYMISHEPSFDGLSLETPRTRIPTTVNKSMSVIGVGVPIQTPTKPIETPTKPTCTLSLPSGSGSGAGCSPAGGGAAAASGAVGAVGAVGCTTSAQTCTHAPKASARTAGLKERRLSWKLMGTPDRSRQNSRKSSAGESSKTSRGSTSSTGTGAGTGAGTALVGEGVGLASGERLSSTCSSTYSAYSRTSEIGRIQVSHRRRLRLEFNIEAIRESREGLPSCTATSGGAEQVSGSSSSNQRAKVSKRDSNVTVRPNTSVSDGGLGSCGESREEKKARKIEENENHTMEDDDGLDEHTCMHHQPEQNQVEFEGQSRGETIDDAAGSQNGDQDQELIVGQK